MPDSGLPTTLAAATAKPPTAAASRSSSFAAYEAVKPKREPDFMRFAGVLSHEDAEAMTSFVDHADFSKVDDGAWK